jgi:MoaA/NifB/PqqE/SkfB family radical SAM enzyme
MQSERYLKVLGVLPSWVTRCAARLFAWRTLRSLQTLRCPPQVTVFLTEACNFNCPHCFLGRVGARTPARLSLEEIQAFCRTNRAYLKRVILTGGEIFTLKDLDAIVDVFDGCPLENITVTTNGFFSQRVLEFAARFMEKGRARLTVQLSLDGPEEYHDSFRSCPGLFRKSVMVAQELRQRYEGHRRFERVYFGVVLTKGNKDLLPRLIRTVKELGVETEWAFMRSPRLSTRGILPERRGEWDPAQEQLMLDVSEMREAYCLLTKEFWGKKPSLTPSDAISIVRMGRIIEFYTSGRWRMPCTAGRSDIVITAQGEVAVCEMTKPVASLKDFGWDLRALVESSGASGLARSWNCACSHECNHNNTLRTDADGLEQIVRVLAGRKP